MSEGYLDLQDITDSQADHIEIINVKMKMMEVVNNNASFLEGIDDTSDLPCSLIATNLDSRIFSDSELKQEFEEIFRRFDDDPSLVNFQYLKSFKRARITFSSSSAAAQARIQCQQQRVGDTLINCYYSQVSRLKIDNRQHCFNRIVDNNGCQP